MTTKSQAAFTRRTLMALLTEQADLGRIPGHKSVSSGPYKEGQKEWICYPAARAAIEETIAVLIRSLANAHGIPAACYPPRG